MYLKIRNMLISVAARVNHEVMDLWRLFNIIYIMRTSVKVCGFCRPGLILGVSPAANPTSANCSCR